MRARQRRTTGTAWQKEALVREVRKRVGDKWTLLVIEELSEGGELRLTQLRDRIGGGSQEMLGEAAADPGLADARGAAALERARRLFTWGAKAGQTLEV